MLRVADYLANRLAGYGVRHIFMVAGGGAMFLNDALWHQPDLRIICNHHEQACAMAAEGYARVSGKIGVLNVTTGPGGINAMNGVFGAWTDSIPMLVISGQVKRETSMACRQVNDLRQLGDQEANIIRLVESITKYAVVVDDPEKIRFHLEKALYLASSGRPGPCWLDIPLDVQSALVDPETLPGFDPEETSLVCTDVLAGEAARTLDLLRGAQRPAILAGSGLRLAGALELFRNVSRTLGIPVVLSRTALDNLGYADPLFCGRGGIDADRAGNFTVQNADVLLDLGSRLGIRQVSYNWKLFAHNARIIQVDIDCAELKKPTLQPHFPICSHLKPFLEAFIRQLEQDGFPKDHYAGWLQRCKATLTRYPAVTPQQRLSEKLNPYVFCEKLSEHLSANDVVACGNGSAFIMSFQAAKVKEGQRWFFNNGSASMGYDLPAAIGACFACGEQRVVCMAGDGSIMMNLQELQTIAHHRLPVKVFILCNGGYLSIRQSEMGFFGRLSGADATSGVSFPDYGKLASAFGIQTLTIEKTNVDQAIDEALNCPGPVVCSVIVDPDQMFEPRSSSKQLPDGRIISPSIEDMYPFLDRQEMTENMVLPPLDPE